MSEMTGAELIAAERQRQMDAEGWSPGHDDDHVFGQLAMAAVSYALPPGRRTLRTWSAPGNTGDRGDRVRYVPDGWPWSGDDWKPGDRLRELVKAGALIAAEIDRLQRAGESS